MRVTTLGEALAEPYAEALLALGEEQNILDTLENDVQLILATLSSVEEWRKFLGIPLIKAEAKKNVVRQVLAGKVHNLTLNFLLLLVDRKRIAFLSQICRAFQKLLRQKYQVALAEVTSAVPLNEQQQEQLRQKIQAMTQASRVELALSVNPDLIGGLVIKIGSQVIDTSVRGELRRLTNRLLASV
ncbi:MAG: ATP synthase F1 subunit delta [Pseudanabaenaceae cyanobacterium SKYGB_i_bin29]|nr:ATP synthase F1 subunit delta [Pseudanabaenaceae cyanobacterium SKYG29]MDW8420355.1 ATP synthase F1 subunit delta [Pseudanabaenaceae cyanobacterium SKYGB_i_bin29]